MGKPTSCLQVHKNTKVNEQAIQYLLELYPCDGGNYVFLSNLYTLLNRWDDVDIFRRLMIERGVHETPGCSSIEVDNVVHEFVTGDTLHPEFRQINVFLDEIAKKLKGHGHGHEPDTASVLHDIDDEEKETTIRYHSVRIAVAFGLMKAPPGKTIHVVKNLRHVVIAIMLRNLYQRYLREIIVRCRNRFHHFSNGSCSCKDYW